MTVELGVGVVGVGLIGQKRIAACANAFRLRAVFDLDHAAAARISASHDVVAEQSLDALLARGDVDVVVVATTHDQLATVSRRAVDEGMHVLIEKPGGVSSLELESLATFARERDRIVRVGFNHRFHPSLLKARELVERDEYGSLLWIRGRYGHGGRPGYATEWRADRAVSGGGELVDQGSHLIDLVRYLVGDAALAFAELPTLFWPMTVEDNAFFALRPAAGGFAWLHASWTEWKNTFCLEVTLERAKIEINGLGGSYGTERLTLYEMRPEMGPPISTDWDWPAVDESWKAEMDDFASAVRGGRSIGASIDDAVEVLKIIEQAYAP
jgi:predicted dehydrogenase